MRWASVLFCVLIFQWKQLRRLKTVNWESCRVPESTAQTFTLITFRLVINRQQNRIIKHNRAVLYSQHLHISCYRLSCHNESNKYVSVVKGKISLNLNQFDSIDQALISGISSHLFVPGINLWRMHEILFNWVPSSNFPHPSRHSASVRVTKSTDKQINILSRLLVGYLSYFMSPVQHEN